MWPFQRFLLLLVLPTLAQALVDYSNESPQTNQFSPASSFNTSQKRVQPVGKVKKGDGVGQFINAQFKYDSISVKSSDEEGQVDRIVFNGRLKTKSDVFVDVKYWQAQSSDSHIAEKSGFQEGNAKLILGFNWLKIGRGVSATQINIYGGGDFRLADDSNFGSSRNDKIVGLETTKKIDKILLGLGFEYIIAGNPKSEEEMSIGNIRKLTAAVGWVATSDIRLVLEAQAINVGEDSKGNRENSLENDLSFSSLGPKLQLLLHPYYSVELGASFQTKRPTSSQEVIKTRLYDYEGSYGNTVYAGLNLTI